jgi:hypothetical protein
MMSAQRRHTGGLPPLAHAGHWALYALYAIPIAIVLGSIVMTVVRDRRERDR